MRDRYAEGLAAHRSRQWEQARGAFTAALAAVGDDGSSIMLLKRIETFEVEPPAADWDGSWHMEHK